MNPCLKGDYFAGSWNTEGQLYAQTVMETVVSEFSLQSDQYIHIYLQFDRYKAAVEKEEVDQSPRGSNNGTASSSAVTPTASGDTRNAYLAKALARSQAHHASQISDPRKELKTYLEEDLFPLKDEDMILQWWKVCGFY